MLLPHEINEYLQCYGSREENILSLLRAQTLKMPESKMQIRPELAQVLCFLIRLTNSQRILEIGTYTGYSSLAIALSTPDTTKIVTCDHNKEWTKIAQQYWQQAGVDYKIQLMLDDASKSMDELATKWQRFDFIFIDADKENYPVYFEKAQHLIKPEGLIVLDNTLWKGRVARDEKDSITQTLHDLNIHIHNSHQFDFMLLPIDDGLTVVRKKQAQAA